jgi:predicted Zn-dependent protease
MKVALLLILVVFSSCGKLNFLSKLSRTKQKVSSAYASGTLKVNVYYENGVEPYTDVSGAQLSLPVAQIKIFNLLKENLKALFPGKNIIVPLELSAMSKLGAQNKSQWSEQNIYDLGVTYGQPISSDVTTFNIFFVKGKLENNPNVIGVHLGNTQTMAIFKEVVESVSGTEVVKMYVEQSTLIHEMGHGLGLVNNPVPMTSNHEDSSHPHHCSNPNCVMYWQNEGLADLIEFAKSRSTNLNPVMFDQACLKDVTSYKK